MMNIKEVFLAVNPLLFYKLNLINYLLKTHIEECKVHEAHILKPIHQI